MKLSFQIAVRFLKSSLTQTLIIILGIGIGVSVQIFIGSLIQGLQKSLVETTIGNSSHITVSSDEDDGFIRDYSTLLEKVSASDSRIIYASPVLDNSALLETSSGSQSLLVRGFSLDKAEDIYKFSTYLIEGALPEKEGEVMLGVTVRDEFAYKPGDAIKLITPDRRTVECTVSGFFDLKVAQVNNSWCVTTIATAQAIFEQEDIVTSLEFQVADVDVFESDAIADLARDAVSSSGQALTVDDWKARNEQLLSGLQGQSISSIMIQVFVMISVILGIASVLAITVMQKSRQIGILKAMGIKNSSASLIFLFEGVILGIFGALAGIGLGLGLAYSFTVFAVRPDGTPVIALFIDPTFIALSGAIAVAACMLASLIPARRSSTLNPIDIIRNN